MGLQTESATGLPYNKRHDASAPIQTLSYPITAGDNPIRIAARMLEQQLGRTPSPQERGDYYYGRGAYQGRGFKQLNPGLHRDATKLRVGKTYTILLPPLAGAVPAEPARPLTAGKQTGSSATVEDGVGFKDAKGSLDRVGERKVEHGAPTQPGAFGAILGAKGLEKAKSAKYQHLFDPAYSELSGKVDRFLRLTDKGPGGSSRQSYDAWQQELGSLGQEIDRGLVGYLAKRFPDKSVAELFDQLEPDFPVAGLIMKLQAAAAKAQEFVPYANLAEANPRWSPGADQGRADRSAKQALDALRKEPLDARRLSGQAMRQAIRRGVADGGKLSPAEQKLFASFDQAHRGLLSPEAQQMLDILLAAKAPATTRKLLPAIDAVLGEEVSVAAAIDRYLESQRCHPDLRGRGAEFERWAREYNVDPFVLVAIAQHETRLGTRGVGVRKALGVGAWDHDPGARTKFDGASRQIKQGAKTFARLRRRGGADQDDTRKDQLRAVNRAGWASDDSWWNGVNRSFNELRKDLRDLDLDSLLR